jgi:hypothetical protein
MRPMDHSLPLFQLLHATTLCPLKIFRLNSFPTSSCWRIITTPFLWVIHHLLCFQTNNFHLLPSTGNHVGPSPTHKGAIPVPFRPVSLLLLEHLLLHSPNPAPLLHGLLAKFEANQATMPWTITTAWTTHIRDATHLPSLLQ